MNTKQTDKINILKAVTEFKTLFNNSEHLNLEAGGTIFPVNVAYQTYGSLNNEGTNAILICHALTGNAHAAGELSNAESDANAADDCLKKYSEMNIGKPGWWDNMIGPGKTFDTGKYFVICSNILGSCYGTTGPVSLNPGTSKAYQKDFPIVTVRDIVKVQYKLIRELGVNRLKTVTGGSLGGMQALEWAVMYPEIVESIIPIACPAKHSDWAIGFNETGRRAIINDPEYNGGYYSKQPSNGFELARMIAMITYRSDVSFNDKFRHEHINNKGSYYDKANLFQVQNYLNYQGKKLVKRFDANAYITLSDVMDLHDITYGRAPLKDVLGAVKAKTLTIGISTDILYYPHEQKEIASLIPAGRYAEIDSPYGHDAFLIEFEQMNRIIREFL
ncbi:MAG: homoserine O-acetyltransferase [Ignavibacteria bacterium]